MYLPSRRFAGGARSAIDLRFLVSTAGIAEFLVVIIWSARSCLCFLSRSCLTCSEPSMSTANISSAFFSDMMPLIPCQTSATTYPSRQCTYPEMSSCRTLSRPLSISVTSTFLRHAFFPFLDGCLYCCGAFASSAMFATRLSEVGSRLTVSGQTATEVQWRKSWRKS